jgi:hypothetical protein
MRQYAGRHLNLLDHLAVLKSLLRPLLGGCAISVRGQATSGHDDLLANQLFLRLGDGFAGFSVCSLSSQLSSAYSGAER